ncbi:MAG: ABC transporter substrate-binding protein, partial [Rhodospirillales bacterium]|nr:ABC transporter substrate-binding protein [Rhodospirillales bacterium]
QRARAAALPAIRPARPAPPPIDIGALFPLSGGRAVLGDESLRGLDLATDARNAAGGLLGRHLRLVKADAPDPAQAAAQAGELIGKAKVAALFGTGMSALSVAATQVSELAGIPYFELTAIADSITARGYKYVFRTCPPARDFAALAVGAIGETLAPLWHAHAAALRIVILHEDTLDGTHMGDLQAQACKTARLAVTDRLVYPAGPPDLTTPVRRLREARAQVVLHTGSSNDIILFYRAMAAQGWRPRMVIGASAGYALADTMQAIGEPLLGCLDAAMPQYQINPAAAPGSAAIAAAYQQKYGAPPRSGQSLATYAGATVIYDAIARAGSLDKDRIRAALLATDIAAHGLANGWGAAFDSSGQNTRALPTLMQWQRGAAGQPGVPVTVAPADLAVARARAAMGR